MDLSFEEIDGLFDTEFDNEDFGVDSEYFKNEEYIQNQINKPLAVKPQIKPILKTTQVVKEVKEKQNMSYDDILKSMNVTLVNGKLVLSKGTANTTEQYVKQPEVAQTKKVQFSQEPIPQEVKNSAIYNKYFKTYNSVQPTVEVRRPKSIEEYRKMLLEDKIKRIQAKRRIAMIKPKTLFFSRDSNPVIHMRQPTNLNKVFNFPR